jgi:hypothetical protein
MYKYCKPEVGIPTIHCRLLLTVVILDVIFFVIFKGIVTEKSPYSEHVYVEAAYKQGWIAKTSRTYFYKVKFSVVNSHNRLPCGLVSSFFYPDADPDPENQPMRIRI